MPLTDQALLDNLEDAGCNSQFMERFLALEQSGQYREQLRLLSDHRRRLLDCLHQEERPSYWIASTGRTSRLTAWIIWSISWRSTAPKNIEPP